MDNDTEFILACLQDVLSSLEEVEKVFADFPNRYDIFESSSLHVSFVERKAEVMGEALARIRRRKPDFEVPNAHQIIATRNRIIHCYDNVKPDFLWLLVKRHFPILKEDVQRLISELDPEADNQ